MQTSSALLSAASVALLACSGSVKSSHPPTEADAASSSPPEDSGSPIDASMADASDAAVDKAASCASTFGQDIGTLGFVRFDGTVVAIVPPDNKVCAEQNSTHLVVQIRVGANVYRMVVDVSDMYAPGTIYRTTLPHALVGDPWQDGWHAASLDYTAAFGLHSSDFALANTTDAVAAITDALSLGDHVSIFATAAGEKDSAHLVHRVQSGDAGTNTDGAIVIGADGASPTWLLFNFSNYRF